MLPVVHLCYERQVVLYLSSQRQVAFSQLRHACGPWLVLACVYGLTKDHNVALYPMIFSELRNAYVHPPPTAARTRVWAHYRPPAVLYLGYCYRLTIFTILITRRLLIMPSLLHHTLTESFFFSGLAALFHVALSNSGNTFFGICSILSILHSRDRTT